MLGDFEIAQRQEIEDKLEELELRIEVLEKYLADHGDAFSRTRIEEDS